MSILAVTALLAAQAPRPPTAPPPPRQWPSVAGWRVFEVSHGCGIHRIAPATGVASAGLLLDRSGALYFVMGRPRNAPARAAGEVRLTYSFDGVPFTGANTYYGGSTHFFADVPPELAERFERSFAQASVLRIAEGGRPVATLSLRGTASALAAARRCLAAVEEDRRAGIYRLPAAGSVPPEFIFAPAPPAPPRLSSPQPPDEGPRRATLRSGYIGNEDYPAAAIRAEEQGRVVISLTIGVDGRVTHCAVAESSGSAVLDSTSCMLVQRRFRYWPALDENDRPIGDTVTRAIVWRLPDDPLPVPPPVQQPVPPLR